MEQKEKKTLIKKLCYQLISINIPWGYLGNEGSGRGVKEVAGGGSGRATRDNSGYFAKSGGEHIH
jgi:hypothetical protein